jgi:hypothetical protein
MALKELRTLVGRAHKVEGIQALARKVPEHKVLEHIVALAHKAVERKVEGILALARKVLEHIVALAGMVEDILALERKVLALEHMAVDRFQAVAHTEVRIQV